ncbi:expressed unknown protein [Seminavis robusta]|uniref:Uncharacterized protein n=1 Tax=Seminavis robusta TaxID=568900 RepID=A0A9N8E4Q5_9STRA|nr:expressed unknown protein [Seminavis robusta]|eukprot:Sro548_g164340.1 n/a (319) ;mRNA; f:9293-10622
MPYRTLCGFPTTEAPVSLLVPNKLWRADTVICDVDGTEWFVLMECEESMRSYEAIFGDMYGHKLCCVRRKMMRQVWNDGFYFCTYRPNFPNQPPLYERDCNNKKVYPFSYLEVNQQKGKFAYRFYEYEDGEMRLEDGAPKLVANNAWLGFMTIWCTPMVRCGKWTTQFRRPHARETKIDINQWKNTVEIEPGQDVLAALCMAYVFDQCQRQPFVTLMGKQDPEYDAPDDGSLGSDDDEDWDGNPRREKESLVSGGPGDHDSLTDNPEEFGDEGSGLEPPSTGEDGSDAPKKKKKKKKRGPSKYPPAEPDEDAFADCLE